MDEQTREEERDTLKDQRSCSRMYSIQRTREGSAGGVWRGQPQDEEHCMKDVQQSRSKGKGPTHGRVARTGLRESRWKGAYTDFNRDDFSRKGQRRRILKIPGKRGAHRFPFFLVCFLSAFLPPLNALAHCEHILKRRSITRDEVAPQYAIRAYLPIPLHRYIYLRRCWKIQN